MSANLPLKGLFQAFVSSQHAEEFSCLTKAC